MTSVGCELTPASDSRDARERIPLRSYSLARAVLLGSPTRRTSMNKQKRKLVLERETIKPLESIPLDGVAGASTPVISSVSVVVASALLCPPPVGPTPAY